MTPQEDPAGAGLDPHRLAEVIVTIEDGTKRLGSGYRITGGAVLTAAHVVIHASSVLVRFDANELGDARFTEWMVPAVVAFEDIDLDVAILAIDTLPGRGPVSRTHYGRIGDRARFIDVHTAGFPLWKRRGGVNSAKGDAVRHFRELHHAAGRVAVVSDRRTGRLEVQVSAPREPGNGISPWEGMSGAPVWSGDYLIGIIVENHGSEGPNWLTAMRVDRWVESMPSSIYRQVSPLLGLPAEPVELPDITLTNPDAASVINTLPRDAPMLIGRDGHLRQIGDAIHRRPSSESTVAVHSIDGMPGIGKTSFAVHLGHRLADQFPDGRLYIDLHAHTVGRRPVDAAEALAHLLNVLGVAPQYLPSDLGERAALWRTRTANRRMLLILDNAIGSAQVLPLLPGSPYALVLITSRRRIADLDCVSIELDTLEPEYAKQMFITTAGRWADEAAVGELVSLCGYLPLAISLLARLFAKHRSWSISNLLEESKRGLVGITAESRSVAAAFQLSYENLSTFDQRFFRLLGLNPGIDIDVHAAAALADASTNQAADSLNTLHQDHLLEEPTYRRYRMHDLIRQYACAVPATDPLDGREAAVGRLLDYYCEAARLASVHLGEHTLAGIGAFSLPSADLPILRDRDSAIAWMSSNYSNLLACLEYATKRHDHHRTVRLTSGISAYMLQSGSLEEARELHVAAVAAAIVISDQAGQANALTDLGNVRYLTGDYQGAMETLTEALGIFQAIGDRLGHANALNELGNVRYLTGDYQGAMETLTEALGIFQAIGDRLGHANALNNLGAVQLAVGSDAVAAQTQQKALDLYQDLDHRTGQAHALNDLGAAVVMTNDFPTAIAAFDQALNISRSIGDRIGQARALSNSGVARRLAGDYLDADHALEEALAIYREIGHQYGEANALWGIGHVRSALGDHVDAYHSLQESLEIYHRTGHRHGEANALCEIGAVRSALGEYVSADQALQQALDIYDALHDRSGTATALNHVGALRRNMGASEEALVCHRRAYDLAIDVSSRWDEGRSLEGMGRCAIDLGDVSAGLTFLNEALEVFESIGAKGETARLTAYREEVQGH